MVAEHVYVIAGPDAVKIGLATNPRAWLKTLQTANYHPLILEYSLEYAEGEAYQIEQYAHRLLQAKRVKGEWFSIDVAEAKGAIERATAAIETANRSTLGGSTKEITGDKQSSSPEKPWYERWRFHPLHDIDFEVIRFLATHAKDSGTLSDPRAEWCIPKSCLSALNPGLGETDYEDTFWLRLFAFWFDYESIGLRARRLQPLCFPKARVIDEVDFYTHEELVEYALSVPASWVIEEHGIDGFMGIIRAQSEGYKLKERTA